MAAKGSGFHRLSPNLKNCVIMTTKKSYFPRRVTNRYDLALGLSKRVGVGKETSILPSSWREERSKISTLGSNGKEGESLLSPDHTPHGSCWDQKAERSPAQLLLHVVPLSQTTKVHLQLIRTPSPPRWIYMLCFASLKRDRSHIANLPRNQSQV